MSKSSQDPFLGKRIREYEILETIGKGGMGAVYRARHVYLDEERAIKVIQSRLAADKDFVDRFIREAKILTKLRHPNLVQLYEFGTLEDDVFFMVLELLRGESVIDRIRRIKRIPFKESIKIVREAALGLHSAHQKGIVHRDMSPDNLVLIRDESGSELTKVIDFGIAKPNFDSTHAVTVANMFMGKPEYCSPEQCGVLEEGEVIDRRSDIYSLGVTFYQMIAGKLPFYSSTAQGYLLKHASEIARPISESFEPGEIPEQLDRIIAKMMTKKREDRYSTMEELVADLDTLNGGGEEPAYRPTAQAEKAAGTLMEPGDLFARRYMIEKKLGEGGMGIVYKAIDKILDVPVALKVVSSKAIGDERTLERFKREVILARKVAHPNACRIYDMGESGGIHYVSMELLKGKTLADLLRESGRLNPDVGLPILRQVLEALQEAHRVGVVHRDLKPQNIMVDLDLHACIMDFGISISKDATRVTQTGILIGTPFYMAPEQFEGKNVDHRTDIYSIGVIMYEIFTGKLPFSATSPMAVIFAHLKSTPPKPSELVPNFPEDLERVILKALEKEPDNRFQNVREFLRAIDPLFPPTSSSVGFSKEALAHKLLAERSYSKAIQVLNVLLKNSPENISLKKLLKIALNEKIKKDLRRAKSLIRKQDLVQAQLVLQKIQQRQKQNPRVISQVRKLESILEKRREKALEDHLAEAEKHLAAGRLAAGSEQLEIAGRLRPNDIRVQHLEEQFQHLKQQADREAIRLDMDRARAAFDTGKEDEASRLIDSVLKKDPELLEALDFQKRIEDQKRIRQEEQRVRSEIKQILAALASRNYPAATQEFKILEPDITHPPFQRQLKSLQSAVRDIRAAHNASNFNEIPPIIDRIFAEDEHGWLSGSEKQLNDFREWAVNSERHAREFQEFFNQGQIQYAAKEWEKAVACFKQAREVSPEQESVVAQWIDASQKRLDAERQMRKQVELKLQECKNVLISGQLQLAQEKLEWLRNAMNDYRLGEFQEQILQLENKVNRAIEQHNEMRDRDLEAAAQLREDGQFREAMQQLDSLLAREPKLEAAVRLREDIKKEYVQKVNQWGGESADALRRAEALLAEKRFEEAIDLLNGQREKIRSIPELQDQLTRVDELVRRLGQENEKEKARQKRLEKEMQLAKERYEQRELESALKKFRAVLKEDPASKEALELVRAVDAELDSFRKLFNEGKQYFDQKKWQSAIEVWEAAQEILPKNASLKDWIRAARDRRQGQMDVIKQLDESITEIRKLLDVKDYQRATEIISRAKTLFSADYDLAIQREEVNKLERDVSAAAKAEATRLDRIRKLMAESRSAFGAGKFEDALSKIQDLLRDEPNYAEAINLKNEIETELTRRKKAFDVALADGKRLDGELRWEEAAANYKKARDLFPRDTSVERLLVEVEKKIASEKKLRTEVSGELKRARDLIAKKRFGEAAKILEGCRIKAGDAPRLNDLSIAISGLNATLAAERQKDEERSDTISRNLSEISELMQKGAFEESSEKINRLLEREPGLSEDATFATDVKTVLNARSQVLQLSSQLQNLLGLLATNDVNQIPAALQVIETSARGASFEAEARDICRTVGAYQESLRSGDFNEARNRLEQLSNYAMLQPYRNRITNLVELTKQKEKQEQEFGALFQAAVARYDQKQWQEAAAAFEKLNRTYPDNQQVQSYLQAASQMAEQQRSLEQNVGAAVARSEAALANGNWDEVIRVSNETLQADFSLFPNLQSRAERLQNLLDQANAGKRHEAQQKADAFFTAGDLQNADRWYRQLAAMEPDNAVVRTRITQIQNLQKKKGSPVPVAILILVPAVLAIAVLVLWLTAPDTNQEEQPPRVQPPVVQPDRVQPLLKSARELRDKGDYDKAIASYEEVLKLAPANAEARTELQQVRAMQEKEKQLSEADAELARLVRAAQSSFDNADYGGSLKQVNSILEKQPRNEEASKLKERILEKATALLNGCKTEVDRKNYDAAVDSCGEVLQIDPTNRQAKSLLAVANRGMESGQRLAQALNTCRSQFNAGNLQQAESACRQVLTLDRSNEQARQILRDIDNSQKQKRVAELLEACARNLTRGQCDSAKQACNEVVQLDPSNAQAPRLLAQIQTNCQPPNAFGEISINSEPWGTVYVDGQEKGPTPIPRFRIKSGPHTITIRKPGFQEINERVTVGPGQKVDKYYKLQKQ